MTLDRILQLVMIVLLFLCMAAFGYWLRSRHHDRAIASHLAAGQPLPPQNTSQPFLDVLLAAIIGLVAIQLAIIAGIFLSRQIPPNWAENVLVSIGTASALKLGDCLSTLVALATGKSVERLGTQLGNSTPTPPPSPTDAAGNPLGTTDNPLKAEVVNDKAIPVKDVEDDTTTK